MDSNIPSEIASTIQAASIRRHPSPRHDLNPSTSVSEKQPVRLEEHPDPDSASIVGEDEIPISVLRPVPRRNTMPPLPDLRFEQSYLKSIERAESWKGVLWITLRDQVWTQRHSQNGFSLTVAGHHVLRPRRPLDPRAQRLEALESVRQIQWTGCRCPDTEMVVGRQQLVNTQIKIAVEKLEAN